MDTFLQIQRVPARHQTLRRMDETWIDDSTKLVSLRSDGGAQPALGDTLKDRFVLEEIVGEGGMGVVYRARDLRQEEGAGLESSTACSARWHI